MADLENQECTPTPTHTLYRNLVRVLVSVFWTLWIIATEELLNLLPVGREEEGRRRLGRKATVTVTVREIYPQGEKLFRQDSPIIIVFCLATNFGGRGGEVVMVGVVKGEGGESHPYAGN